MQEPAVYDQIADWFDRTRTRQLIEKPHLECFASMLASDAAILDIGCGTGEPILRYFSERGCRMTGIDASAAMIGMAQGRFPRACFLVQDMRTLTLDGPFDGVVMWHSLFHLPHADQRAMFATCARLLRPGGLLMFTSGTEYSESWSDNGGAMLYHASLDMEEYRRLLAANGFAPLLLTVNDTTCGGATVWVAKLGAQPRG